MKTSVCALLAAVAFAVLLYDVADVEAKTTTLSDQGTAALSTPLDSVIDMAVAQRVASGRLTAAQALVAREQAQMQFLSLTASEQQALLASARQATDAELAERALKILNQASVTAVREALAKTQAKSNREQQAAIQPKLGAGGDLVFVTTDGPCRVADSRNGPGQLQPFTGRQLYVMDSGSGLSWVSQGGTGTSSTGNCVGSAFNGGMLPDSVVAIVTAVNTVSTGAMQAWNGGTTLSGGAVVVWNPGDRATNTTVIPANRSITPFAGSGSKRDIALYNNSGAPMDYVVDVVGYFIVNEATELDCTTVFQANATSVPANGTFLIMPPACPAGYTTMTSRPYADATPGLYVMRVEPGACRYGNLTGSPLSAFCDAFCCRVPGR